MSHIASAPAITSPEEDSSRPYVEWAPILAAAIVATTIALVLTSFGSAIGLAMTSPYPSSGASGRVLAIAAGLYTVWILASAGLAGGYLVGRLRHRSVNATEHEAEIRNGSHGLVVWALAALITGTLGLLAVNVGQHGDRMTPAFSQAPAIAGRYADSLLRSERAPPNDAMHRQVTPILEKASTGKELASDERSFLSRVTAAQTGASAPDADARVTATLTAVRDDVDAARRLAVLAAFVAAVSAAISAAAAWWGATLGAKHREEGTNVSWLGGQQQTATRVR